MSVTRLPSPVTGTFVCSPPYRPQRLRLLRLLARCRFLSVEDWGAYAGITERVARGQLEALVKLGLADYIVTPQARDAPGGGRKYYYPVGAALERAAATGPSDVLTLARHFGLSTRGLLHYLQRIDHHVAARKILFRLLREAPALGGEVVSWRPGPVRWRYRVGARQPAFDVDGEITIALPSGVWRMALLYDGDPSAPPALLRRRLDQIAAIRDALAQHPRKAGEVTPAVLLVTARAARVPIGYRTGVLWTTERDIETHGVMGAPWRHDARVTTTRTLDRALPLAGHSGRAPTPGWQPDAFAVAEDPRLRQRAGSIEPGSRETGALMLSALIYPPRFYALLAEVAAHPLMDARALADATWLERHRAHQALRRLVVDGLVHTTPLYGEAGRLTARHTLTARGLRLLALRAGLTPQDYREVYAALGEALEGAPERRGLRAARRADAHTERLNDAYLSLRRDERDGLLRLLSWRGEWACQRTFKADDRGRRILVLPPDAEILLVSPHRVVLHAFVEMQRDRHEYKLWRKLRLYARYQRRSNDQTPLLVITTNASLRDKALAIARTVAPPTEKGPPLGMRVTTWQDILAHGLVGAPWHDGASSGPLFVPASSSTTGGSTRRTGKQ